MLNRTIARVLAVAVAAWIAAPHAALAIDPPNWVAALHMAAQGAVGLRWTPVPGATGYKVLRSATAGSGHAEIASTTAPQHFDKDIQPGATYFYVLKSVGAGETSAASVEKSVAIPGEKKKEVLAAPALREPTFSQTTEFGKTISKVGLAWDPVIGAIAYNIYRSAVAGKDYQMLTSSNEPAYLDANVEVGKTYYYAVTALDQEFQETPRSTDKMVLIKEPPKREAAAVRKEKIKIMLRATRPLFELTEGDWGKFLQPSAVAVAPNGDIYIADLTQHRVFVFNSKGDFLFQFGEGALYNPKDIAISDDGRVVVVADNTTHISIFSDDGKLKKTIEYEKLMKDVPEDKRRVGRIEAGSNDRWYLSNMLASQVYVVDDDFSRLETLGTEGEALEQFMQQTSTTEDRKDGLLIVADTFNTQVKLWKDGKVLSGFGSFGNSVGQFARLVDVAVSDTGDILALDFANANVQGFDRDGKFLYVLGTADLSGQVQFGTPSGIAVRGKNVYITETLAGRFTALQLLDEVGPPKLGKK
jgi:hypothetical protein